LIKPSKTAQTRHLRKTGEMIRQQRGNSQEQLINPLGPVITGWSRYYAPVVLKAIFTKMYTGPSPAPPVGRLASSAQRLSLAQATLLAAPRRGVGLWENSAPASSSADAHSAPCQSRWDEKPL
jgi:hypothetical protein